MDYFTLLFDGTFGQMLSQFDISGKRLTSFAIRLEHCYGHMAGLARLDVSYDARFARMGAADDVASGAVFQIFA